MNLVDEGRWLAAPGCVYLRELGVDCDDGKSWVSTCTKFMGV